MHATKKALLLTDPWVTVGRDNHKDKRVPARVLDGSDADRWAAGLRDGTRLKLVLLESRNAVLYVRGEGCAVVAPAALFLTQDRSCRLDRAETCAGDRLVLFHPRYIFDTLSLHDAFFPEDDPAYNHDGYLLSRFAAQKPLAERVLCLESALSRFLGNAVGRMKRELEAQPDGYWPCRARSFLLQVLIACAHLGEIHETRKTDTATSGIYSPAAILPEGSGISLLFNFLVARLDEKLTVDRIAREFGTNRTSLQQKVRRATGLSFTQYLIRLRVQTASVLLRNTGLSIPEIMERTGFVDETHFGRIFKKTTGRSPVEFRKAFVFPGYLRDPAY